MLWVYFVNLELITAEFAELAFQGFPDARERVGGVR